MSSARYLALNKRFIPLIARYNSRRPMQLELCALDEMIICDNLEVFRANGFDFDINYDRPVTQRVQLTAYPFSKSAEFGIAGTRRAMWGIVRLPLC